MTAEHRKLLRVGALAKAVGKTVRALHLYEELGLLRPATRSSGGYRLYSDDAVARVTWIAKLQEMGLSLPEIQGVLRDYEGAPNNPSAMQRVRTIFEARLRETRDTLARLRLLEQDLQASLAYLESCGVCPQTGRQDDCPTCDQHRDTETPDLVAGLAGTRTTPFDVPLSHLTGGTR